MMKKHYLWAISLVVLLAIIAGVGLIEIQNLAVQKNTPVGTTESCNGDTGTCSLPSGEDSSYRTITDMAGRMVTIPTNISMVLSIGPPPTTFVFMLAPGKLRSINSTAIGGNGENLSALSSSLSGSMGMTGSTNYEAYISMHPDLVFVSCESGITDPDAINITQEKLGTIPAVCVDYVRNATMYGPTLLFMGDVLGVPDVATQENAYYQGVLGEVNSKVAAIPEEKRVKVYYAEGNDGLSTDPGNSCHSQLIDVCGGINVAGNNASFGSSESVTVTKESVLLWKPDVIITTSPVFYSLVYNDTTWQQIPAVQNHRVYLTPSQPYNWFDRPPGVNRIVGIPWTAHVLYPGLFTDDWLNENVKEFYGLFYHVNLSDSDLQNLLSP